MKKTLSFLFLIWLFANSVAQPSHSATRVIFKVKSASPLLQALRQSAPRSGHKMVSLRSIADTSPRLTAFLQNNGLRSFKAVKPGASTAPLAAGIERVFVAEIMDGASLEQVVGRMKSLPDLEYAEPDYLGSSDSVLAADAMDPAGRYDSSTITPNDPQYPSQWGLKNTGQVIGGFMGEVGMDINVEPAWDITTGNDEVLLAVLDSGIPDSSDDLSGRVVPGYDYANNDTDVLDDLGHGSNVTGIAAATGDNGQLLAGIDWQCRILHMKVLNESNFGFYSWWLEALVAVADSGADVINMSLGGTGASSALRDGIDYAVDAGAIVVASMMNTNAETPYYPAAYPNVIAVGALNNRGERAVPFCYSASSGSNFGDHIDFVAPGELIVGLNAANPDGISYYCGTSQASPMVAGVVSLLRGLNPELTFGQAYDLLKAGAKDQVGPVAEDTEGWDPYFGWGLVDAAATVNALLTTVEERNEGSPGTYALTQNFPNPFNPTTTITYQLSKPGLVSLKVYNLRGQLVRTIVDKHHLAGTYTVAWDGQDANGQPVASGIYVYKLHARNFVKTRKMVLVR